jgi:hypothetical protein
LYNESNTLPKPRTDGLAIVGSVEHPERRFEFAFGISTLVQLRAVGTTAYRLVARARSLPEHDGILTISGERMRESKNGEKAERTERYVGAFRRSITLPTRADANKVSATYVDGILTVTLPKAEEVKPKQIPVS